MGKGNRVRTQNADERKAKKEAAIKKAAKERLYHRITMAVSVVLVIALVFGFVWAAFLNDFLGRRSVQTAITMKTENYSVSAAEFNYLYMNTYLNYQSYASYIGLDTSLPLEDQAYTGSGVEGYTWHDYIVDNTETAVRELLVLCEAANERGITLDDDEKAIVDDSIEELKKTADDQGMSFEKFTETYFGDYITEEDIRSCMEMQTLAGKASEAIQADPTYTDEDLATECKNNPGKYYFADYRSIEIEADYATGASTDVINAAKEEAKAAAQKILDATKDEATFLEAVKAYYSSIEETEEETEAEESTEPEKTAEEKLQEKLDATLTEGHAYSTEDDIGKWLFEQDAEGNYIRKAGDVKPELIVDSENGTYTVCMVVKPYYRNDYATRNVRHLLITVDSYDEENGLPDEEAKAKAEALLEEWKAGEATEDTFADLATKNTMDEGSSATGGLYENVAKGDMVEEFENWLYDEARVAKDTGIVKTEYGYHIMYYVGESETLKWEADAEANLRAADYEVAYEKLTEKYAVTVDDNAFKKVKQAGV